MLSKQIDAWPEDLTEAILFNFESVGVEIDMEYVELATRAVPELAKLKVEVFHLKKLKPPQREDTIPKKLIDIR
jgi:hypothetical protein